MRYVPKFVSREEWNAAPPTKTYSPVHPRDRKGVVIHHNGPPLGLDAGASYSSLVSAEMSKCRGIQAYHQTRGWSDCAYSWMIGQSGNIYEVRGLMLPQFANGSDQVGVDDGPDRVWYSAMWLGGGTEVPTPAAIVAAKSLVHYVRLAGAGNQVLPHNSFKHKSCPGPDFTELCWKWDQKEFDLAGEDSDITVLPPFSPPTQEPPVSDEIIQNLKERVRAIDARSRKALRAATSALETAKAAWDLAQQNKSVLDQGGSGGSSDDEDLVAAVLEQGALLAEHDLLLRGLADQFSAWRDGQP